MASINNIPSIFFKETALPEVGFEVIELANLYQRATGNSLRHIYRPHRINFHSLIVFTQGTGQHFIDFQPIEVQELSMVLVNKGQIHAFDGQNTPQGKLILFTQDYLKQLASVIDTKVFTPGHFTSNYQPSWQLTRDQQQSLLQMLSLLADEYSDDTPNHRYLHLLFATVLTKATETKPHSFHQSMTQAQLQRYGQFLNALEQHFTQTRDAHDYADMLNVSYKTLNNICKLACNQTAKQLIDSHTILEAKRRLTIDDLKVQQLADVLGFDEASNFVKYFRKHTELTPRQFKQLQINDVASN